MTKGFQPRLDNAQRGSEHSGGRLHATSPSAARLAELNEMIAAGWGDFPQSRIPQNWRTRPPGGIDAVLLLASESVELPWGTLAKLRREAHAEKMKAKSLEKPQIGRPRATCAAHGDINGYRNGTGRWICRICRKQNNRNWRIQRTSRISVPTDATA